MVNRIRVQLDGFQGGPGVATFYSTDLSAMRTALFNFWGRLGSAGIFPGSWTATIASEGDIINSATGAIEGTWTGPTLAPSASSNAPGTNYVGPAGACVRWRTATVADGSRVSGRTFLVPMTVNTFDAIGSLLETARVPIETISTQLVQEAAPGFVIWHRPRLARAASPGVTALLAHPGSLAPVTSSSVADVAAVLRSRRQ